MQINIKITTKASRNEVIEIKRKFLHVLTTAVPEKGKANKALVDLLSNHYKIPKSSIKIIKRLSNKNKVVDLDI